MCSELRKGGCFDQGLFGFCHFSVHVVDACSIGPRCAPKKSNYDEHVRTISFVSLATSHDLVETMVFGFWLEILEFTVCVYIYMAITSISGPKKGQNFNFPQFYRIFWWYYFCNNHKDYYNNNSFGELFCNILASMVNNPFPKRPPFSTPMCVYVCVCVCARLCAS